MQSIIFVSSNCVKKTIAVWNALYQSPLKTTYSKFNVTATMPPYPLTKFNPLCEKSSTKWVDKNSAGASGMGWVANKEKTAKNTTWDVAVQTCLLSP